MHFKIKRCFNKQKWNRFVNSSPQVNIFCHTVFLDALGVNYDLLFVEKDKKPQLGAIVLKQHDQCLCAPYATSLYQGILFANSAHDMPYHRRIKWQLETTEFLLSEMEKQYSLISFCLHYAVDDLRSFQWFHYHEPQKGQFKIDLNYTGLINLEKPANFKTYLKTIRKVRSYEYRQALKNKLRVQVSNDIEQLDYLHELTFSRQGIKRSKIFSQNLKKITKVALSKGFGKLLLCQDSHGRALSAALYLFYKKSAYYLFGANHPNYRHTGSGTFIMLENIRDCYQKKIQFIDVCGINSPNRGDFKTSFNALIRPYFIVTWRKTKP